MRRPVAASTLMRTKLGGRLEVDGMLSMVRWVGRTVESFTYAHTDEGSLAGPSQSG